jgi:hypothetical protein
MLRLMRMLALVVALHVSLFCYPKINGCKHDERKRRPKANDLTNLYFGSFMVMLLVRNSKIMSWRTSWQKYQYRVVTHRLNNGQYVSQAKGGM